MLVPSPLFPVHISSAIGSVLLEVVPLTWCCCVFSTTLFLSTLSRHFDGCYKHLLCDVQLFFELVDTGL